MASEFDFEKRMEKYAAQRAEELAADRDAELKAAKQAANARADELTRPLLWDASAESVFNEELAGWSMTEIVQ